MSLFFYNIITYFLSISIPHFSRKNSDFKKTVEIRKNQSKYLREWRQSIDNSPVIQIHCASLGELEMSLPLFKKLKTENTNYRFLFSFFSSSGYNSFDVEAGDTKCYLPLEKGRDIEDFLSIAKPNVVLFIKNEFWFKYLDAINEKKIPFFFINNSFQQKPFLFRFPSLINILKNAQAFYPNNLTTKNLMYSMGLENIHEIKDLRYTKSISNREKNVSLSIAQRNFLSQKKLIICGSIWPQDESIIMPLIEKNTAFQWLIAPHKVDESNVIRLMDKLPKSNKWTTLSNSKNESLVILNTIGELKYLYAYASVVYIGGAFKTGLHNIIEPAVYGKNIIFGPKYKNDSEAQNLIDKNVAFSIKSVLEFENVVNNLMDKLNTKAYSNSVHTSEKYVHDLILLSSHITKLA